METLNKNKSAIPVIIVAAGMSQRMDGINKQFLSVDGLPVIVRTLINFQKSEYISKIIVVTKDEDIKTVKSLCKDNGISKLFGVVAGGETRHKSVLNGITALNSTDKTVLIQDGARPFLSGEIIKNCVLALKHYDSVLVAVKVTDTVKKAKNGKFVEKTLDRKDLYLAQTPQGVCVEKYLKASKALTDTDFTDDASIMEAAGYDTVIVDGSNKNIKITTQDDIPLALLIAKSFETENKS